MSRLVSRSQVLALLLVACAPQDRDIRMRCEVETAARILDTPPDVIQLGRTADHLLLTWRMDRDWAAAWFDLDGLGRASEDIDLGGFADFARPRWVSHEGRLSGYLIADPARIEDAPRRDKISWWTLSPPPIATSERRLVMPDLPPPESCDNCIALGASNAAMGEAGVLPVEVVSTALGALGVVTAPPSRCVTDVALANQFRMQLFSAEDLLGAPVLWSEDPCYGGADTDLEAFVPFLLPLPDESVGLLYRGFDVFNPVHYVRVRPDGEFLTGPFRVGHLEEYWEGIWTNQPRAAIVGERILFIDGDRIEERCSGLRMLDADGTNARDAAFQLPCRHDSSRHIKWIEIGTYGEHFVVLWSERIEVLGTTGVTSSTPWDEDVKFALVDVSGKLASEPISVLEPGSTALMPVPRTEERGPFAREFRLALWARGSDAPHVAWRDYRRDAPGVYARQVQCAPTGTGE